MNDEAISMKTYSTQDLPLAATLIALGQSLQSIERTNPKRAGFCFVTSEGLETLVNSYHKGSITIEPRAYFDAIRQLKNRLYGS